MSVAKPRHREWLNSRNEISRILNDDDTLAPAQVDNLSVAANALEALLMETPPQTADELIAVMTFAMQIAAEGSDLDEAIAARIVAQARGIVFLGSLRGASYDLQRQFAEGAGA